MSVFKVIIIDDHPLIIRAYKEAVEEVFHDSDRKPIYYTFDSIKGVMDELQSTIFQDVDLAFLDIRLPPSRVHDIYSGEDLGALFREKFPKMPILISTTFNDNFRMHSIIKNIDPDGFVVKSDLTLNVLINAVNSIVNDPPYYSSTVLKMLRKEMGQEYYLDQIDRKILYELSLGTKMKDMPDLVPLSIAGIEKRKRNLKIILDVEGKGDRGLIAAAKEKGFI